MNATAHHDFDRSVTATLDAVGLVGQRLRTSLAHDLKTKIVMRDGRDPVEVVGARGCGKHTVVEAAHRVAHDVLGRRPLKVNFDCGLAGQATAFETALGGAVADADGGTLVLDRFDTLPPEGRLSARRLVEAADSNALILAVRQERPTERAATAMGTSIRVKALHERDEDIWELIDHFFGALVEDHSLAGCRGFSRQAKADISAVVEQTNLSSVRRLRDIVRDLVFEVAGTGTELPLKLTSELVRPHLEAHYGQTEAARLERQEALIASQFDQQLSARLADTHGVSVELMERQAAILNEIISTIDDVPTSYRNIMDRAEDVQRAALWLMTGANTQAEFRKHFGEERFMRPTKSVAWAFYNRVFKRDM